MEADRLAALYDAWAPRLLAYMMTLTRDRSLAEDALQNLFVKLATSSADLRAPAVYLYRAARNEALRISKRRPALPLAALEPIVPRIPAPPVDPSTLAAALDELPPEQMDVLLLHALEGMTFREIGGVLDVPPDTAASRYRYAVERMQLLLRPWTSKTS